MSGRRYSSRWFLNAGHLVSATLPIFWLAACSAPKSTEEPDTREPVQIVTQATTPFGQASLLASGASPSSVALQAVYPDCPQTAVKVDVWSNYGGTVGWQADSTCYLKAAGGRGTCPFRSPRYVGFGGAQNNLILRLWRVNQNCSYSSTSFDDYIGAQAPTVVDADYYRAFTQSPSTQVTIVKNNYQIKLDRRGGAVYEYYNTRTGLAAPRNAVLAESGAALQVDFAKFEDSWEEECQSTGGGRSGIRFWNPTQAGSSCGCDATFCAYPPNRPFNDFYCDNGALCASGSACCSSATTSTRAYIHQMMSFTYGRGTPSYYGAYNARDSLYLDSQGSYNDTYAMFTNALINTGSTRSGVAAEIPTWFAPSDFSTYFYEINGLVVPNTIPPVLQVGAPDYNGNIQPQTGFWYTIQDTTSGGANSYITMAVFFNRSFLANIPYGSMGLQVVGVPGVNANKFTWSVVPSWGSPSLPANTWMAVRFVIFPYKYSDVISTSFGANITVQQTIAAMRSVWDNSDSW